MNFRGKEEDRREDRCRERFLFVELRLDIRVVGLEREVRTAEVVLSMDDKDPMNCRRGEESDEEAERQAA